MEENLSPRKRSLWALTGSQKRGGFHSRGHWAHGQNLRCPTACLQALGCEASHLTIRGLSFLICKGKENTGLARLSLSGSGAEMCSADVG